MENLSDYFYLKENSLEFLVEQRVTSNKQKVMSNEQKVTSNEQKVTSIKRKK